MTYRTLRNTFLVSCTLAVALTVIGCDGGRRGGLDRDEVAPTTGRVGPEGAPMTIAGCLQKADGHFVLTQATKPSMPVGTSGGSSAATDVEREQLRAAQHAFRLSGADKDLDHLVGKQIRVTGMLTEMSEIGQPGAAGGDRPRGTTGNWQTGESSQGRDRIDIKVDDLAKIDVQLVEQVAPVCGGAASRR